MPIEQQYTSDHYNYQRIAQSNSQSEQDIIQTRSRGTTQELNAEYRQTERLESVHSELARVFKSSQVKHQEDFEMSRFLHIENMKSIKDELMRTSTDKKIKKEQTYLTEQERSRRISVMESLLGSKNLLSQLMKGTSAKLSFVHKDLKDAFQRKENVEKKKRRHEEEVIEDNQQMILEEIRRNSAIKEVIRLVKEEQYIQMIEFDNRDKNINFYNHAEMLSSVLDHMLILFHKHEGEKERIEQETRYKQENAKLQVQEELLYKANKIMTKRMSIKEQQRRITEIPPVEESMALNKVIVQQELMMHVNCKY